MDENRTRKSSLAFAAFVGLIAYKETGSLVLTFVVAAAGYVLIELIVQVFDG